MSVATYVNDRSSGRPITREEHQILARIDQGIRISETELRYQLDRNDGHPLASEPTLLDVLADLETNGLIESTLHFQLSAQGRAELRVDDKRESA